MAGGRPWWRRGRAVLAIVALLLLTGAAIAAYGTVQAVAMRRDLLAAQAEFDQAAAIADPLLSDFGSFREAQRALAAASTHLTAARASLDDAQRRLDRLAPFASTAAHLPGWPRGLSEVQPLLTSARDLTEAGLTLSDAFTRLTDRIDRPPPASGEREPVGARLADGLTQAEPDLIQARIQIERALALRRSVRDDRFSGPLSPARHALATFDRRIRPVQDNLDLLVQLPSTARAVLGMDGPRTYAVLGQNSAELRPTGGFIGSLGLVTVENGTTVHEDYRGSYTFDNPKRGFDPLPPPMAVHLGGGGWALRDANWSPDFPTTAATVEQMLLRHQDVRVDGVIAFNTYTVALLLDAVGPVTVEGFDTPISADTWYDLAQRLIYFRDPNRPFEGAEQNKGQVLEPVLQAVIRRIQQSSTNELPRVLKALQRAVDERQLLVSFHDPAPQQMAERYGAAGRITPPATGDVLAVVDANLSYSKVGPYIDETIAYDVWLNARGVAERSRLAVTYRNKVTRDLINDPRLRIFGAEWDPGTGLLRDAPGVYGTYTRVYVPRNSRLIDAGGQAPPAAGQDLGFTTFEQYHRIAAGTEAGFVYGYQIPIDRVVPDGYRLRVVKESGTAGHAIVVRVHLPAGVNADASVEMEREGDALVYRGHLTADLDLAVSFTGADGR